MLIRSAARSIPIPSICALLLALTGCTNDLDGPGGTFFAQQTGATTASGGFIASGGALGSGGFQATGGTLGTGAFPLTGGVMTSGGQGQTGGFQSGGTQQSGGVMQSGGSESGGVMQSGGSESGGVMQSGGSEQSGGSQQSGGTDFGVGETGPFVGVTAAHNAIRDAENAGIPPLTWSDELAAYAQEWADSLANNGCGFEHRQPNMYGENLYKAFSGRGAPPNTPPADVVNGWAAEKQCYTFGSFFRSDSCDAGCVAGLNANGCGHYTQIVWRDTARVGCGRSTCGTSEIWVCNYDPPGNFIGREPY